MRVQRSQLPEVIRVLAQHRGVKTYEMAAAIGISSPSMSARLYGKVPILQHEMSGLARILDCPEEVLRLTPDVALRWSREHPPKVDGATVGSRELAAQAA